MYVVGVEGKGQETDFQAFFSLYFRMKRLQQPKARAAKHTNWEARGNTKSRELWLSGWVPNLSSRIPHGVISLIIKIH